MSHNRADSATDSKADFAEISIATVSGLAVALIALFLCFMQLATQGQGRRDFVIFWATGHQLVHHGNPYDPSSMERIEHAAGFPADFPAFYMRNPPWALPLVLPLGVTSLLVGNFLWALLLLGLQITSGWLIWRMFGRPPNRIHWLSIAFAPSLMCLFMGQTALFALFGLVLFLWFHRSNPLVAGLALWLGALKPHLFLPYAVVLLAWIIVSKSYKVLVGFAVAFAASCAFITAIYPASWSDYARMMRSPEVTNDFVPCLAVSMRLWLSPQHVWIQFLPAGIACIWAIVYFWRRRRTWDWVENGSFLLLLSLVVAPYCWFYDLCIAIPALLQGAYSTRSRPLVAVLALLNIPVFGGLIGGLRLTSVPYLWIAPMWFTWYLIALRFPKHTLADERSSIKQVDTHSIAVQGQSD